jgi:hypothetical protein
VTFDVVWLVSAGALALLALLAWMGFVSWRASRAAAEAGLDRNLGEGVDTPSFAAERRRRERRLGDRRRIAARDANDADDPRDLRDARIPRAGRGRAGTSPAGREGRRHEDRALPTGQRRREDARRQSPREADAPPTTPGALAFLPAAPAVTRLIANAGPASPDETRLARDARPAPAGGERPPAPPGHTPAGAAALVAGPAASSTSALPMLPAPASPAAGGAPRHVTRVLALERASDADWDAAVPMGASEAVCAAVARALPAVRPGRHALAFADDAALRIARGDAGLMRSMATVHRFAASDRTWLDAPAATSVCGQVLATLAETRFLSRLAGEVAALRVEAERSSIAGGISIAVIRLLHDAREGYAVAIRSPAYQEAVDRAVRDARAALGAQRTLVGATANALRARLAAQRRDGARDNGDGALDLAHRLLAERRSEAMVLRSVCALDALRIALGIALPVEDDLAAATEQATVSDRALASRWPNLREALERVHLLNGERTARRAEALRHGWRTQEQSAMLFEVGADGRVAEVRTSGFGDVARA